MHLSYVRGWLLCLVAFTYGSDANEKTPSFMDNSYVQLSSNLGRESVQHLPIQKSRRIRTMPLGYKREIGEVEMFAAHRKALRKSQNSRVQASLNNDSVRNNKLKNDDDQDNIDNQYENIDGLDKDRNDLIDNKEEEEDLEHDELRLEDDNDKRIDKNFENEMESNKLKDVEEEQVIGDDISENKYESDIKNNYRRVDQRYTLKDKPLHSKKFKQNFAKIDRNIMNLDNFEDFNKNVKEKAENVEEVIEDIGKENENIGGINENPKEFYGEGIENLNLVSENVEKVRDNVREFKGNVRDTNLAVEDLSEEPKEVNEIISENESNRNKRSQSCCGATTCPTTCGTTTKCRPPCGPKLIVIPAECTEDVPECCSTPKTTCCPFVQRLVSDDNVNMKKISDRVLEHGVNTLDGVVKGNDAQIKGERFGSESEIFDEEVKKSNGNDEVMNVLPVVDVTNI